MFWDSAQDDTSDLEKLAKQALEDERKGNLIPGGFDGIGEAIEELKLALETVHKVIALGIPEKWQHFLTSHIYKALAEISLWENEDEEKYEHRYKQAL